MMLLLMIWYLLKIREAYGLWWQCSSRKKKRSNALYRPFLIGLQDCSLNYQGKSFHSYRLTWGFLVSSWQYYPTSGISKIVRLRTRREQACLMQHHTIYIPNALTVSCSSFQHRLEAKAWTWILVLPITNAISLVKIINISVLQVPVH